MVQRGRPKKQELDEKTESKKIKKEEPKPRILASKQEVADELGMGVKPFNRLLRKYPFFNGTGVTGKLNGRWHVPSEYVHIWLKWALKQESRHPESRRMRPSEAPDLKNIKSRLSS